MYLALLCSGTLGQQKRVAGSQRVKERMSEMNLSCFAVVPRVVMGKPLLATKNYGTCCLGSPASPHMTACGAAVPTQPAWLCHGCCRSFLVSICLGGSLSTISSSQLQPNTADALVTSAIESSRKQREKEICQSCFSTGTGIRNHVWYIGQ